MKRHPLILTLVAAILLGGCATLLTGCDDDGYWPYGPPSGWGSNFFYDSRLDGVWELTQANLQPVTRYDTNYMDFYGGGHGRYYYYQAGRQESEQMAYFCQENRPGSTSNAYKINIQYGDGTSSTMAYWFSNANSTLCLQWNQAGQMMTYYYTRIGAVPW